MENLVVTLETAKTLKAAGFPQTINFWWKELDGSYSLGQLSVGRFEDVVAAPTAQEIADQLRPYYFAYRGQLVDTWYAAEVTGSPRIPTMRVFDDIAAPTMAEALALLWLKLQDLEREHDQFIEDTQQ